MEDLERLIPDDRTLGSMSPAELDGLPFGAIKLDRQNRVVLYNAAESRLACRDPQHTVGRHFFEEVAPCTNTLAFRGRLEQLLASGSRSVCFDFRFVFRWGVRRVRIQLWATFDARWIFVFPR